MLDQVGRRVYISVYISVMGICIYLFIYPTILIK
jgi:hypothetical protein